MWESCLLLVIDVYEWRMEEGERTALSVRWEPACHLDGLGMEVVVDCVHRIEFEFKEIESEVNEDRIMQLYD